MADRPGWHHPRGHIRIKLILLCLNLERTLDKRRGKRQTCIQYLISGYSEATCVFVSVGFWNIAGMLLVRLRGKTWFLVPQSYYYKRCCRSLILVTARDHEMQHNRCKPGLSRSNSADLRSYLSQSQVRRASWIANGVVSMSYDRRTYGNCLAP